MSNGILDFVHSWPFDLPQGSHLGDARWHGMPRYQQGGLQSSPFIFSSSEGAIIWLLLLLLHAALHFSAPSTRLLLCIHFHSWSFHHKWKCYTTTVIWLSSAAASFCTWHWRVHSWCLCLVSAVAVATKSTCGWWQGRFLSRSFWWHVWILLRRCTGDIDDNDISSQWPCCYWWSVMGRGNVIVWLVGLQAVAISVVMPLVVGILLTPVQVQPLVQPTGADVLWLKSDKL